MVFKKYIQKGGKIYGPYYYENKRVNGKVVTSYVGRSDEQKEIQEKRGKNQINKKIIFPLTVALILILFAIFFYQQVGEDIPVITGQQGRDPSTVETACGDGRVDEGEQCDDGNNFNGDGCSSNCQVEGVDDGDGGASISFEEKIEIKSGESVLVSEDPRFLVEVKKEGIPSIDDKIEITRLKQSEITVSGKLTEWRTSIKVPIKSDLSEIIIDFPVGARYPNVRGSSGDFSLKTIPLGGNIFDLLGVTELKIRNPQGGNYEISFFISGPYVSDTSKTSTGETIVINNLRQVSYDDVSIVAPLLFKLENSDALKVISPFGDEVDYKVFDVDNDVNEGGEYDFIRFIIDISAKSKLSYDVILLEEKVLDKETRIISPLVSEIGFEDLPEECREGLSCGGYSSCSIDSTLVFRRGVVLNGKQVALCISDNPLCSPVYEISRECDFPVREVIVERETDIFLEPGEEEKKRVIVYAEEADEKLARVTVTAGKVVDIEFLQESGPILYSPSSCFNSIQDGNEDGVDCGGFCNKRCFKEKVNLFFIWWILLAILITFFFLNSVNVNFWRINRLINSGRRALSENDLQNAIANYYLIGVIYLRLDSAKKMSVRRSCLDYYAKIKDKFVSKKIKVKTSRVFGDKLPYLVYDDKKHKLEKRIVDADISRIKKLIDDGYEVLFDNNLKMTLFDYDIIRSIYHNLSPGERKKVKRLCARFYDKFIKWMRERRIKYRAEAGFLPEIILQ